MSYVDLEPAFSSEVCIPRPRGCDIWVVKNGREYKLWKSGHDPKEPFPTKWALGVVDNILAVEQAEATETAAVLAEKEPAKIDELLAFAKGHTEECCAELDAIARKKREVS